MTRRDWLLDLLRCPRCREPLRRRGKDNLACANDHRFPVVDGVPRFTPASTYADSFGFEWTRFPKLQLDSERMRESEEAFRQKTGLQPEDVHGKTVLDGGCGMGRFSDVAARWGAARLVSVDISRAVEAASENVGSFESARVLQADLRRLPLAESSFDIVFSLGVLHHTPDTRQAFAALARFVKPGGVYCVWVYARELMLSHPGSEVLRLYTRRLQSDRLLRLVERTVPRIHRFEHRLPVAAPLLRRLVPISQHPDPDWRILDTFDWYSPRYQWKHTYEEVEGWFRRLEFVDVTRLSFPVAVRGRRSVAGEP